MHQQTVLNYMRSLGYVVQLESGEVNPRAKAAADLFLARHPRGVDSVMIGPAISKAWNEAKEACRG